MRNDLFQFSFFTKKAFLRWRSTDAGSSSGRVIFDAAPRIRPTRTRYLKKAFFVKKLN